MLRKESITESRKVYSSCTAKLFVVLALSYLLLIGMHTRIMADDNNAEKGFAEVIDINLQARCPSMQGLPEDSKDVKGFRHKAHAKEYLKGNATFTAVKYDGKFTCTACHPGSSSENEISREPICERLSGVLANEGGPKNLKKYYHEVCLDCHKNMHKADKATGPVKCIGCHIK
ncbi:MAG: hypothetical protein AVO38_03155 [delta proteobacterium ML8_D]|nr:MAG: hypothetical protein AVO38_03155 [delta proteobacterium ML8_D]